MNLRLAVLWTLILPTLAVAQPYKRTQVPGKQLCLAWSVRDFTYHVDVAGSARTPQTSEFVAIDTAYLTWQTLANT